MDPSYNNSFGSFGSSTTSRSEVVFSSGSAPKKSKRGLIVGVIIAVLVLAAIVMALVFGAGFMQNSKAGFEENFYRFANYVLYGEDSTAPIEGAYRGSFSYYFFKQQKTDENRGELYKKTGALLAKIKSQSAKINAELDDERQLLAFMEAVYTLPVLDEIDIARYEHWWTIRNG